MSFDVSDFFRGYAGEIPIYSKGVKIGYWKKANRPCEGNAQIYTSIKADPNWANKYPPYTWMTKDDLWRDISMTDLCLQYNIVPQWASQVGSTITAPSPVPGAPAKVYSSQSGDIKQADAPIQNIPLAIGIAGAGILGLILVLRR